MRSSQADFDDFARKTVAENLHYVCTTRYDEKLTNLPVAFPPEELHDTLGEIVSAHGLTPAAHCGDGEIRTRYILLQWRHGDTVPRRGPRAHPVTA